jgi:hypothetical protein
LHADEPFDGVERGRLDTLEETLTREERTVPCAKVDRVDRAG